MNGPPFKFFGNLNDLTKYVGTEVTIQRILVTKMANLVLGACMNIVTLSISSHEQTEKNRLLFSNIVGSLYF